VKTPKTKRVKLKASPAYRPRKPVPDPTENKHWPEEMRRDPPMEPPFEPNPPPHPDPWEALAFAINQVNYLVGLMRSERNPEMEPVIDKLVEASDILKLVDAKRTTKGD
jgi:hypothetical protein